MTEAQPIETASGQATPRFGFQRRTDRRVLAGLSAGIGDALGVDAAYVRAAFVLLTMAGGIGVVLYGLGWVATIDQASDHPLEPLMPASESENSRAIGFQLIVVGMVAFASTIDLTLDASILWPASLIALGVANVWAHGDTQARDWLAGILPGTEASAAGTPRERLARLVIGGTLAGGGIILALTTTKTFAGAGIVVVSVSITFIGLVIVLGPWMWRLWQQLATERRQRIRSEEKTELAAHLHDSVLQTLALIQSTSDPEQQAVLARIQERELRQWLFTDEEQGAASLKAMMDATAAEVEKTHKIVVESVTVGDTAVDVDTAALVAATREAMINTAKHSGKRSASLFTEVGAERIEVFVTDHGRGFVPDDVDEDRQGIAESIKGRMQRHGGTATITSAPDEGTEVHLTLPVRSNQ